MSVRVHACETDGLSFAMPDRFRHEIAYFASDRPPTGGPAVENEWWVDPAEADAMLAEGVIRLVSPLDRGSRAEVELSEEQEAWLEWVVKHRVRRVRLE